MLHRWPTMRQYMWSQWLLAFAHPELLAASDELNMWAKMEAIRRSVARDAAVLHVFGEQDATGSSFMPTITLEGQRRAQ